MQMELIKSLLPSHSLLLQRPSKSACLRWMGLCCAHLAAVLLVSLPALPTLASAAGAEPADAESLKLVPWPKSLAVNGGHLRLSAASRIVALQDELEDLAEVLADEIGQISDMGIATASGAAGAGDIALNIDNAMDDESYRLVVSDGVVVVGGSYRAVSWGTATLLQAICTDGGELKLPRMTIEDSPDSEYRALMLDVSRQYHTIENIEQIIQLCRLYKINYLHLHLTDDQLFMFPSQAFPDAGRSNSELTRFAPPSVAPPIEPYTLEEMHHIEAYSQARGVTIIPEVDMPGHAARLIADVPDPFRATTRNSSAINFAGESGIAGAATLLNELMDVFEATPYIHLGGDEVWMGHLDEVPDFQQAIAEDDNADSVRDLYHRFNYLMNEVVRERGKQMIVWEEAFRRDIDHPYALPRDVVVLVWCLHNSPQTMIDAGHQIINGTWTPLYLVRDNKRSVEFIYDWHRELFGRERFNDWLVIEPNEKQLGAQMLAWEQSECFEIQSLRKRLAAMSERIWNAQDDLTFEDFMRRIERTDAILEALVHPVSITVEGELVEDEHSFEEPITIHLTAREDDLEVRYTLDNSTPNQDSNLYEGPFTVDGDTFLRVAQFDDAGRRQGYMSGAWFRQVARFRPNLATNRPVQGTNPEHNSDPRTAVNGNVDRGRHWAGGTPSSLTVDLEDVHAIDRINLLTYYDGSRYYQYRIEVSTDSETWKVVDDASDNTAVAGPTGYQSRFEPVDARFVRVHMLRNSANPGTHIVELMVFEAE